MLAALLESVERRYVNALLHYITLQIAQMLPWLVLTDHKNQLGSGTLVLMTLCIRNISDRSQMCRLILILANFNMHNYFFRSFKRNSSMFRLPVRKLKNGKDLIIWFSKLFNIFFMCEIQGIAALKFTDSIDVTKKRYTCGAAAVSTQLRIRQSLQLCNWALDLNDGLFTVPWCCSIF